MQQKRDGCEGKAGKMRLLHETTIDGNGAVQKRTAQSNTRDVLSST